MNVRRIKRTVKTGRRLPALFFSTLIPLCRKTCGGGMATPDVCRFTWQSCAAHAGRFRSLAAAVAACRFAGPWRPLAAVALPCPCRPLAGPVAALQTLLPPMSRRPLAAGRLRCLALPDVAGRLEIETPCRRPVRSAAGRSGPLAGRSACRGHGRRRPAL